MFEEVDTFCFQESQWTTEYNMLHSNLVLLYHELFWAEMKFARQQMQIIVL